MSTPTNTYDFIVVGAGTAGCVIAARLSENAGARVLLLEAGGATASPASGVPAAWPMLLATESAWGDSTVVQAAPEKAMPFIRGRGIGGSSAINAMMFARGHRACYDSWEQAGATGWGFDALLPYFKRSETAVGGDPALRGVNGPLLVAPPNPPNELATAGLSASAESGYARATDVSGGLEIGFGLVDLNIVDGQRQSAADAYLTPALHRANLDFVADAVVHRLWIEGVAVPESCTAPKAPVRQPWCGRGKLSSPRGQSDHPRYCCSPVSDRSPTSSTSESRSCTIFPESAPTYTTTRLAESSTVAPSRSRKRVSITAKPSD